ncbi:tetratricopeptide repeat protein [Haliangium ochraceum]|uniref:Tetratricopeptide TPR_2 repeat protein n=1 Tax=Haliangium ochraceum (strain DSM 14365 / JCM 11303 / SMP-2) TaxID=502025 RepID=D0LUI1_HALO1|nr:tetratricopeptide repeat protein [Haliangium ochraceum]ACY19304.1 Tetratricopeptide TPR_2 repeat protein [Haliangium ochraceum DSM 14365]
MTSSTVDTWQIALRRGLEHQRAGRFEESAECFEQAHRLAPSCPEVCYALGRARLRAGAALEAEALLRFAWDGDRTLLSAAGTLARCLGLHQGRFDDGYQVLDQGAAAHGATAVLEVVRSELLLAQERLDEAREAAEGALEAPGSETEHRAARLTLARVLHGEGMACADAGEMERAMFLFRQTIHLDDTWARPQVNLGVVLTRLGMHARAMASFERALELEPDNAIAFENRGLLRQASGDIQGACADLGRAIELEPGSRNAVLSLVAIHRERGDIRAAASVLADAIEAQPDDVALWAELGLVFCEQGDRRRAESCWRRALQLQPDHEGTCRHLASLLVRDGRLYEATVLAQRLPPEDAAAPDMPARHDRRP